MDNKLVKKLFYAEDKIDTQKVSVLAIAVSIIISLPLIVSRIIYPYDLGRYESHIWASALLSIDGYNPYSYAVQSPFIVSAYGYLYYLIVGGGLKIFGLQFWSGRIISLMAAVLCVICVGKLVFLITNKKYLMYLAMLSVIVSTIFQSWLAVQRADLPSLAFGFLAITIAFYNAESENDSIKYPVLVGLCLISALFCKQVMILPCVIVFFRYLQVGKVKHSLVVFLTVAVTGAVTAALLNYNSGGGYYFQQFQITRNIPYSYYQSLEVLKAIYLSFVNYIIFPVIVIGFYRIFIRHLRSVNPTERTDRIEFRNNLSSLIKNPKMLFVIYAILAFILAFYTSARSGASDNYYLEFTLAVSVLFAFAVPNIRLFTERREAYLILSGLLILTFSFHSVRFLRGEYFRWNSLPYYQELVRTLDSSIPMDGICISSYPDLAALTGRKFEFGDISQYIDGRSPELKQIVSESLKSDRYSAIILLDPKADFLSPNCRYVPMKNNLPPEKFYAAYLYVCQPRK